MRPKVHCEICNKLISTAGMHRHMQTHDKNGAPYLKNGVSNPYPTKTGKFKIAKQTADTVTEVEVKYKEADVSYRVNVHDQITDAADILFPQDPYLWTAVCYMAVKPADHVNLELAIAFIQRRISKLQRPTS